MASVAWDWRRTVEVLVRGGHSGALDRVAPLARQVRPTAVWQRLGRGADHLTLSSHGLAWSGSKGVRWFTGRELRLWAPPGLPSGLGFWPGGGLLVALQKGPPWLWKGDAPTVLARALEGPYDGMASGRQWAGVARGWADLWNPDGTRAARFQASVDPWEAALLDFSEQGEVLAVPRQGLIELRDPEGGLVGALEGHRQPLRCLAFWGNLLVSADAEQVRIWDWREKTPLDVRPAGARAMAASPGRLALAREGDLEVLGQDGTVERRERWEHPIQQLAWAWEDRLLVGLWDRSLLGYDPTDGGSVSLGRADRLAVAPSGWASATVEGEVRLWALEAKPLGELWYALRVPARSDPTVACLLVELVDEAPSLALQALREVEDPACRDAVCAACLEHPDEERRALLRGLGWIASGPPELSLATALLCQAEGPPQSPELLLRACGHADPEVALQAACRLGRRAQEGPWADRVCGLLLEADYPLSALKACQRYESTDPRLAALFGLLCQGVDRHRLAGARTGDPQALVELWNETRHPVLRDWLRGLTPVAGSPAMADLHAETTPGLWERVPHLPPQAAVQALRELSRSGYVPELWARSTFADACALADQVTGRPLLPAPALGSAELGTAEGVGFSPSGQELLTWADRRAALWFQGQCRRLESPEGARFGFSPCGRWLLASGHQEAILWELPELNPLWKLALRPPLALSPDGRRLVTRSGEGLRLLDVADGEVLWEQSTGAPSQALPRGPIFAVPNDPPGRVVFSPDGARLASSHRNRACVWESATGRLLSVAPFDAAIARLAFLDREHLVVALGDSLGNTTLLGYDRTLYLMEAETGREVHRYAGSRRVLSLALEGRRAAVGDSSGGVRLWHLDSEELLLERTGSLGGITLLALSAGCLAYSGPEASVVLTDGFMEARCRVRFGDWRAFGTLAFHPDGKGLALVDEAGHVRMGDLYLERAPSSLTPEERAEAARRPGPEWRLVTLLAGLC